jgi:ATPase
MDKVQYNVAKAIGTNAELIKPTITPENELTTSIDDFFTLKDNVMSVHLKEGEPPTGKYGSIEDIQYTEIHHKPCTSEDIHKIKNELYHLTRVDPDSRIEMSSNGATVFQIRDMRIAATTPPFSNKMEITAVRPVINIDFEKYRVPHDIKSRIHKKRGILIAGAPGAGKSTFAAGMATYISLFGNVVKTMENPRDLQVPNNITQYGPLDEEMANTAEMLLLVRPDFTLYDEVRKTKDFEVFADMRLAGIGMIGVVHANKAVDAVQRMITRTDIGLIPQIVDTIIFIDKGNIETIYTLELTVKIPHGMASEDLARPVVKVINYSNNKTEFEIYTFGEQTIVMPITNVNPEGTDENIPPECRTPEEKINKVINEYVNNPFEIEIVKNNQIVLYAHPKDVTALIGKGGKRIRNIERKLNLKITVKRQGNK